MANNRNFKALLDIDWEEWQKMLQPRIELGPKRWQRSILPLNYCSLAKQFLLWLHKYLNSHLIHAKLIL